MIRVAIPSQLIAYTDGATRVEATGATVGGCWTTSTGASPG
jgi:hypothetical protein